MSSLLSRLLKFSEPSCFFGYSRVFYRAVLCGLVVILTGCAVASETGFGENYPCWMNTLASGQYIGQIGVARNIGFGSFKPAELAKARAVGGLCDYLGKSCDDSVIKTALENETLDERSLYFAEHVYKGYVYGYASFSKINNKTCSPSRCSIAKCDPSWLCSPTENNQNGLLGVSYRATSLSAQMGKAIENALFQAEFLYGVTVAAQNNLTQSSFGTQNYFVNYQQSDIDLGTQEQLSYYVKHQCRFRSTLYRHVVLADNLPTRHSLNAGDTSWIQQPKYLGIDGAVGVVERPAASGLVSDQIKIAIKQAATELAFEKFSHISAESIIVTFGQGGVIEVSSTEQSTLSELKAQLVAIHFEQGSGSFLKVYTWIAMIE